nr:unconventional myosin-IXAb-like [Pseudochaenichthys georgianus]
MSSSRNPQLLSPRRARPLSRQKVGVKKPASFTPSARLPGLSRLHLHRLLLPPVLLSCPPTPPARPHPHYRFRSSSSGPLLSSCGLGAPLAEAEGGQGAAKSRHRIRLSRSSPREPSGGIRRDSDFGSGPQQLVLYGSNEFMV